MKMGLIKKMKKDLLREIENIQEMVRRKDLDTILPKVDSLLISIKQWTDRKNTSIIRLSSITLMNIKEQSLNNNVQNKVTHVRKSVQYQEVPTNKLSMNFHQDITLLK